MALFVTSPELKQIVFDVVTAGFLALSPADAAHLTVAVNDPMDFADFPFIGINLMSDSESQGGIGDSFGDVDLGMDGGLLAGAAAFFQQNVEVKLWCANGDERDRLGTLVKAALMTGRGTDVNPGLFVTIGGLSVPRITGGVDEGISVTGEQYAAHTVYTRTYYVSATCELVLQESAPRLDGVTVRGDATF